MLVPTTLKSAVEIAGKVSKGNTKMPGSTFALDAFACNVGSRLAELKGSTCFKCYARRIQKLRPSVNMGWSNNQTKTVAMLDIDPSLWEAALVFQIKRMKYTEHRWLDSGDVPNVQFLASVCEVARQTPNVQHWLPTREVKTLLAFIKQYGADHIPDNLNKSRPARYTISTLYHTAIAAQRVVRAMRVVIAARVGQVTLTTYLTPSTRST